ncbi:MAG: hypothetical protein R3323_03930, partial [Wenzhouxiangellaceae bacterium]|nr:hypothetical protein [Wenzhouxiangellaceae bacterium]
MDADAARMQIRELGQRIRAEAADADDVSLADVMDALHRVRTELKDTVAGQEETERLLAESGGVISEVDEMTFETIVSIVRDEFRNGQASARRLAQIIRRILPDPREVRRLLPMLKKGLLEEGMSLADYANFVNELSDELQGDDLVQALETGAESTGVGVDEIVREIRRDPGEAARLVVLAAELRQAGRPDESLLSDALVDYIEKVGDRLGGERPAAGIRGTRETIGRIQEELVREVRERGIGDEVADRIRETFRAHFGEEPDEPSETSLYRARSSRLVKLLRESGTVEENDIVRSLERLFERETDLDTLGATMRRELAGRGFPAEKIQQIYDETIERLRSSKRIEMTPGEVLDPGPTEWFLTREITSCIRYGTHFSAILLMIARLREGDGSWRAVSTEEIEQLMSDVFELLPMHLRDLDLLGTLGSQERNVPLILLPMTDQPGAENVLERMLEGLAASRFTLDGPSVRLDPIGVAQRFDPDETPDRRAFVQALRGQLANRLVARLREDPGGAPA